MIIETFKQRSQEWFSARAGIPTASKFSKIVTSTGKRSDQQKAYLLQLAGESILGIPEESYTSYDMGRGTELEPEAVLLYELITGNTVNTVGMCYRDNNKLYSCSPDGLIDGKEKGLEIKCPKLSTHVGYLLGKKLPTDYFQQVHGSMHVTDFPEWDFMSYYPGMPPLIITVYRDMKFDKLLHEELVLFSEKLNEIKKQIQEIKEQPCQY